MLQKINAFVYIYFKKQLRLIHEFNIVFLDSCYFADSFFVYRTPVTTNSSLSFFVNSYISLNHNELIYNQYNLIGMNKCATFYNLFSSKYQAEKYIAAKL